MAFQTSAVTGPTCYFTYSHKSNLKLRFLHLPCTNITVNMTKVVIKILPGSAVTKTTQDTCLTKTMKISRLVKVTSEDKVRPFLLRLSVDLFLKACKTYSYTLQICLLLYYTGIVNSQVKVNSCLVNHYVNLPGICKKTPKR